MGSLVYVGNLPSKIRTKEIEPAFARIGRIKDIYMRGANIFVQYLTSEDAQRAVRMLDGNTIGDRRSKVEISVQGLRKKNTRQRVGSSRRNRVSRSNTKPKPLMETAVVNPMQYSNRSRHRSRTSPPQLMSLSSFSFDSYDSMHRKSSPDLPPIISRCYSPRSGRELPPIRRMPSPSMSVSGSRNGRQYDNKSRMSPDIFFDSRSTERRDRHGNIIQELQKKPNRLPNKRRTTNRSRGTISRYDSDSQRR